MIINRVWAMPNKWTFKVKPIGELVSRYVGDGKGCCNATPIIEKEDYHESWR